MVSNYIKHERTKINREMRTSERVTYKVGSDLKVVGCSLLILVSTPSMSETDSKLINSKNQLALGRRGRKRVPRLQITHRMLGRLLEVLESQLAVGGTAPSVADTQAIHQHTDRVAHLCSCPEEVCCLGDIADFVVIDALADVVFGLFG